MHDSRNPQDVFAFEFDEAQAVSGMRLADDWSKVVKPEEFGYALLMAYAEQHGEAAAFKVEGLTSMRPGTRYPRELRGDVLALSRDVSSMLKALSSWSPTVEEPRDVGDRHRHITVQSRGGVPNEIKVNESWLRTADSARIENDVVEAFQAMSNEAPKDEFLGQLAGLRERLADVVERRNDHTEG